ncbi:MAG: hypothetical protein H6772_02550 [Pseudomonadales bacterium]|nr:hypothetical protein [Pseudomonadales bacterium]
MLEKLPYHDPHLLIQNDELLRIFRLAQEFFSLGFVSPVISVPINQIDSGLAKGLNLDSGQRAEYVIKDISLSDSRNFTLTDLIGNAYEVHYLVLNVNVYSINDGRHWPEKFTPYYCIIDVNGDVYRITSSYNVSGLTQIRTMEKLSDEEAEEILKTAIELKRYLSKNKDGK